MKKSIVRQVLEKNGPCLSSDLAERIKWQHPSMSPEAIRKMISRSTDIGRLPFLKFSHNRRFIYLKDDFGSFNFWKALERCMHEANSTYSHAILAVINNGGYLKVKDFGIMSGSPIKQAKHLSYETVLKNLVSAKIFRIVYVDGCGDCLLINNNIANDVNVKAMANCESFFDKPILELVKAWLRNLGLVAFNQVKTKYDGEDNPVVGSFEWDMTAPSYVSPLAEYTGGKLIPGFVACDFSLGFNRDEITTAAAETFIRKVQMTKASRSNQRIMFVLFARRFGKDAFNKLRNEGVLAITIANAFGNKVDESLTKLSRVVKGSLSIEKHPEELLQMVKDLESVSGENSNLRGYIFELFVSSQISNFYGSGNVYINREYRASGKHAEADVVLESSDDIYIIECKNVKLLSSAEVTRWMKERVPTINCFYKENNPERKNIHHYLWVTGNVYDKDLKRLASFKDNNKKIDVDYLFGKSLDDFFHEKKRVFDLYRKVISPSYKKGSMPDCELEDGFL
ncbi:NERD domain-containing protein [Pectobacterium aroidearum]|uniref:NERD domain-containing protein n=1 Tax=Pectobacterium aroidearum TaxID=1201031 RepID=UPI0015DF00C1|nr:NERD domain-containing protein [Pectobacterium aroidearum]MBA0205824.1 NERD domain-containing protein [Pectobacterium aroidearum]